MAELAKTQRDIEHRDVPQHRQGPAHAPQQQPVDAQRHQRWQHHRQAPGHPAVVLATRVEIAAHRKGPRTHASVNGIDAGQGARLLDQQSEQDGEETHGRQSYWRRPHGLPSAPAYRFAFHRIPRREAADSAVARQGEPTTLVKANPYQARMKR
ncbi:hypothetical protein SDC9_206270 [bioreactor metagenome]|uniref:Uncharacterized protein n=1 Tax=bioreactor metagenome TaxID=1076179 RepID=A0A645JG41_9ZZZZ